MRICEVELVGGDSRKYGVSGTFSSDDIEKWDGWVTFTKGDNGFVVYRADGVLALNVYDEQSPLVAA